MEDEEEPKQEDKIRESSFKGRQLATLRESLRRTSIAFNLIQERYV